ncbi:hypothetical protein GGS26DRAFT_585826 [Hypomontagnella submonticulosa]|nr:hypothetical protein GGS26DRAFT_585826 [Hypomontagnella submonticulosa]
MKYSGAICLLIAASAAAASPSPYQKTRAIGDILRGLKRDISGTGFAHIGSDNIIRTFDKDFNVIDSAYIDGRSTGRESRSPSAAVLEEAKQGRDKSVTQVSRPRPRNALEGRQELSCVSEFCPEDQFCKGLSIYGYNCTSCLLVSNNIGNCQEF